MAAFLRCRFRRRRARVASRRAHTRFITTGGDVSKIVLMGTGTVRWLKNSRRCRGSNRSSSPAGRTSIADQLDPAREPTQHCIRLALSTAAGDAGA